MSKMSEMQVKCPKCKKEFIVTIYDCINETLSPKLKEKLIKGELTNTTCECGQAFLLDYPILYHKMNLTHSTMINYTQEDSEEVKIKHKLIKGLINNNPFSKSIINKREDIVEVYNDWDKFIERIKEI